MSERLDGVSTVNEVIVLGFGYAREFADRPSFDLVELDNAQQDGYGDHRAHPATLNRAANRLTDRGFLDQDWSEPKPISGHRPRLEYWTTPLAAERLMLDLIFYTTHEGMTVSELLVVRESVAAVRKHAHIERVLLHLIMGECAE